MTPSDTKPAPLTTETRCNCIRHEGLHARICPLNDDAMDRGFGTQVGPWGFIRTMGGEYLLTDARADHARLSTFVSEEAQERFALWLAGEEGELVGLHGKASALESRVSVLTAALVEIADKLDIHADYLNTTLLDDSIKRLRGLASQENSNG
jgi:hypothetical protein